MFYRWNGDDLLLTLRVQPRASRDELVGPHGDALKVRITTPPVEGAANLHLQRLFAQLCAVSPAQVSLISGESGRNNRLRVCSPRSLPPGVARKLEN